MTLNMAGGLITLRPGTVLYVSTCSGLQHHRTSEYPPLPPSLVHHVQGCNITGPLPTNWSSAVPLATGAYINLYPVNIDLSRNRLTVSINQTCAWRE